MTIELLEKLKTAKTEEEIQALIKTAADGKETLSVDALSGVSGGQYDSVNNPCLKK